MARCAPFVFWPSPLKGPLLGLFGPAHYRVKMSVIWKKERKRETEMDLGRGGGGGWRVHHTNFKELGIDAVS